jgi:hypothetical protein
MIVFIPGGAAMRHVKLVGAPLLAAWTRRPHRETGPYLPL